MKEITVFVSDLDEKTGNEEIERIIKATMTDEEWEAVDIEGILGYCDGDCDHCEDDSRCQDSMDIDDIDDTDDDDEEYEDEYDDDDEDEAFCFDCGKSGIDLYEFATRALSLTALIFSAATAIKAWKKVR